MNRLIRKKFSSVVTPPFLYGHRHPRIAGLIRFNDEISAEAQRVLQRMVFAENKFLTRMNPECIDLVEIVSDDTSSRSDNPNLIESGTGVMIRTNVEVPGHFKIFCGISLGFQGVGIRNDSKKYFANQVRAFSDDYLTDHVIEQGGGLVLTCHQLDEEEGNIIDLPNGHEVLVDVLEVDLKRCGKTIDHKLLTNQDFDDLYEPCIRFDPQSADSARLVGVLENDTLLYGGSITSENILVDPFITVDCPEDGHLSLPAHRMVFTSSDKYIHKLFPDAKIRYVVTGKVVGDTVSPNLVSLLKNRPWVLRGLLV